MLLMFLEELRSKEMSTTTLDNANHLQKLIFQYPLLLTTIFSFIHSINDCRTCTQGFACNRKNNPLVKVISNYGRYFVYLNKWAL